MRNAAIAISGQTMNLGFAASIFFRVLEVFMLEKLLYVSIAFTLSCSFSSLALSAGKTIKVAAYELSPYSVQARAEKGYLYDIVVEAYKNEGYTVDVQFLPPARARASVKDGQLDVLIPSYSTPGDKSDFIVSEPMPGSEIGLLGVKGKHKLNPDKSKLLSEQLGLLSGKKVGIVLGAQTGTAFDSDTSIKKEATEKTVLNIDKMLLGRVDFVLVDKYEAADSLVSERPALIGKLEFIQPSLAKNSFYVSAGRKNAKADTFIKDFNSGLAKLKKSGRYQEILYSYGQSDITSDDKTINIATVANGDMKVMQELSKEFLKANPGVKLNWAIVSENILRQLIFSSLAISDSQFDVMTIGAYDTPIYAKKGWLEPLAKLPASYDENDLLTTIKNSLSVDAKLYALPFYGESSMTYYRKDLFDQAGLKMPEQPKYSEILSFAKTLHKPGMKQYGICLRGKSGWGENMALVTTMVNTFGGRWFDMDWKPQITGKGWSEALETYIDLLKNYGPPLASANGFPENLKLFAAGNCAMWIDATVAAGMLFDKNQSKVADKVGFTSAPIGTVDKGSHWVWTWALGIPTSSSRKELATKFLTWATSKEYINLVGKERGWVAVPPGTRKSTYMNENYKKAAPFAPFVLKAIEAADPIHSTAEKKPYIGIQFATIPEFPAIGMMTGNLISDVLNQKITQKAALAKAQDAAVKIMEKSDYKH